MIFLETIVLALLSTQCECTCDSQDRDANWPNDLKMPFKYATNSPVTFDTCKARPVNESGPLIVTSISSERILVCNIGKLVLAAPIGQSGGNVTGGVLGKGVYRFAAIQYVWSNDRKQWYGNLIDDKGTPLQIVFIYFNIQYETLKNALNHRDGIVLFLVKLDVQGNRPNPQFMEFEKVLNKIQTEGKCVETNAAIASYFGDETYEIPFYYAYPGSIFIFTKTGIIQSYSATIIAYPISKIQWISIKQFKAFLVLKNRYRSPVDSYFTSYDLGPRPLVQAKGLTLYKIP